VTELVASLHPAVDLRDVAVAGSWEEVLSSLVETKKNVRSVDSRQMHRNCTHTTEKDVDTVPLSPGVVCTNTGEILLNDTLEVQR
jgi:hypothetical protein